MAKAHKFKPDWVIAPSETLKEWLDYNGLSVKVAAVAWGGRGAGPHSDAVNALQDVLERKPYGKFEAEVLSKTTGVSEQFWLNMEHNYRAGLAAGLKDITDD